MLKCPWTWCKSPVTEQWRHRLVLSRGVGCSEGLQYIHIPKTLINQATFGSALDCLVHCFSSVTKSRLWTDREANNKVLDKIVAGKWDHSCHARTSKFLRHIISSEIGLANCCLNYRPYTVLNRRKTWKVQSSKLLWFVLEYDPLYVSEEVERDQKTSFRAVSRKSTPDLFEWETSGLSTQCQYPVVLFFITYLTTTIKAFWQCLSWWVNSVSEEPVAFIYRVSWGLRQQVLSHSVT